MGEDGSQALGADAADQALLRDAAPPGIELRLGYEVTARPARLRPDDDPARFRIEGTEFVLVDGPQAVPWLGDATMERLIRRIRPEGARRGQHEGADHPADRDRHERARLAGPVGDQARAGDDAEQADA
ncbi:MAG: hypothetical protein ACKOSO_00040, partial [Actinomycetota bacterium]